MWRIERANGPTARAVGAPGDTLAQLAFRLGLDADERDRWLGGASDGALSKDEPLSSERSFDVPNVVYMAWFGEWGALGKRYMRWERNRMRLQKLGFDVVVFDNDRYHCAKPATACLEFVDRLARASFEKSLYALYIVGHGNRAVVGSANSGLWWNRTYGPQWSIRYRSLASDNKNAPRNLSVGDALKYKLGAAVVQACESDNPDSRGLVGASGLFWGARGLYLPRPMNLGAFLQGASCELSRS